MESEDSDNLMTMFKGTDEGLEEKEEEEEAESGLSLPGWGARARRTLSRSSWSC